MNHYICVAVVDECASNPCTGAGARCVDGLNSYTCICSRGWSGRNCERSKFVLNTLYPTYLNEDYIISQTVQPDLETHQIVPKYYQKVVIFDM